MTIKYTLSQPLVDQYRSEQAFFRQSSAAPFQQATDEELQAAGHVVQMGAISRGS